MFAAQVIQHAKRVRHIVICGLSTFIFPHYLIRGTIFGGGGYLTQNVCFDFLYNCRLKRYKF